MFSVVAVGLLWWLTCDYLSLEWKANPQYGYGWAVPFLCAYLLWQRWEVRPTAEGGGHDAFLLTVMGAALVLLLPVRLIQEANPDWRVVSWVAALIVVTVTLGLLGVCGGAKWVRHFAFPVLFLLVAVPWPTAVENGVIQSLTRLVTALTVELANWTGIPAMQYGNLIQLAGGVVGVNDACSGIRSFQAALMASLFLGEYYRFRLGGRVVLVVVGALAAVMTNIIRAYTLVWVASHRGTEAIGEWHDPAGLVVFLGCFGILFAVAILMNRLAFAGGSDQQLQQEWGQVGVGNCARWPSVGYSAVAIGWMLLVLVGVEWWYRSHEDGVREQPRWSVEWPEDVAGVAELEIAEEARVYLRFDEGTGMSWKTERGIEWMAYFFLWEPGRTAAQMAASHSPEVCLPAAGCRMVGEQPTVEIATEAGPLTFRRYTFMASETTFYVFHCLWENFAREDVGLVEDWSARSRLAAVVAGRRHRGQQVLEVALIGPNDADAALEELRSGLTEMIVPEKQSETGE